MLGIRRIRTAAAVGLTAWFLGFAAIGFAANGIASASGQDKSFIASAMQDNADLRALSDLALQRIRNPKVRDFASTVTQSSKGVDNVLTHDALANDVKPPGTLSLRASDQYSRIQSQSGRDAADEYLRDVAIDARVSEDDFSSEAQSGGSGSLKRLASQRAAELERLARAADSLRGALR